MVEGLDAQYEQTLKNIHALVTSQGGSKHDIARITVFLTEEPSDWSKIKDANEKYLNQSPPAKKPGFTYLNFLNLKSKLKLKL